MTVLILLFKKMMPLESRSYMHKLPYKACFPNIIKDFRKYVKIIKGILKLVNSVIY